MSSPVPMEAEIPGRCPPRSEEVDTSDKDAVVNAPPSRVHRAKTNASFTYRNPRSASRRAMHFPQLAGETANTTKPRRLSGATAHLEVLQHEHAESLTQDAVRFSVVAPPVRGRHPEQREHDDEQQRVDAAPPLFTLIFSPTHLCFSPSSCSSSQRRSA